MYEKIKSTVHERQIWLVQDVINQHDVTFLLIHATSCLFMKLDPLSGR